MKDEQFLVFGLNGGRFALPLEQVQRVVRAVAITPMPDPPPGVRGVINVAGQLLPVLDLRQLLQMPPAELSPSDYFILVSSPAGPRALLVNDVLWIITCREDDIIPAQEIFPEVGSIRGAVKLDHEIIFIHDPGEQAAALNSFPALVEQE